MEPRGQKSAAKGGDLPFAPPFYLGLVGVPEGPLFPSLLQEAVGQGWKGNPQR